MPSCSNRVCRVGAGRHLNVAGVMAAIELAWAENRDHIAWEDESVSSAVAQATVEAYLRDTPIPVDERQEAMEVDLSGQGAQPGP
jgi:hypothetical protein